MTVIALDDTDSREMGMCTTYVAAHLAERLGDATERTLLVRLNPAVEYKTRGNAALAVHADVSVSRGRTLAAEALAMAATDDPRTNPGAVVAPGPPDWAAATVADVATDAMHRVLDPGPVRDRVESEGFEAVVPTESDGRGLVGALAAVGAWAAHDDWTRECIAYRERDRWGTDRDVDETTVFAAADDAYPDAWDTVDHGEGYAVCVPRTPCPILHGVRGDDAATVERVSRAIDGEPVARRHTFLTNQGTDAHLRDAPLAAVAGEGVDGEGDAGQGVDGEGDAGEGGDGGVVDSGADDEGGGGPVAAAAYRTTGTVVDPPATREGGHVFFAVGADETATDGALSDDSPTDDAPTTDPQIPAAPTDGPRLDCAAFEPTKRFRDRVRALRPGDRVTVCGEVTDGTLKLEKFAVRDLATAERVTPTCPDCGRTMESAGRDQGYRCRDCGTAREGKATVPVERDLERGWYEVPPVARRHVAKPLVRGGFDAPVHPER